MRDAAVGFQCPDCVAEGAKSTRSGRTAYGGLRPGNAGAHLDGADRRQRGRLAARSWPPAATAAGWSTGWRCAPPGLCARSTATALPERRRGACTREPRRSWLPGVSDGAYWQLITSAFTHVEIWHIGFNMLALWVLGPQLELAIGRARFLALYLLSGAGRLGAASTGSRPSHGSTLGASGAIFGLMGALLVLALKVGGHVQPILIWIGINFVFTVRRADVSWQGHLGGFLGGAADRRGPGLRPARAPYPVAGRRPGACRAPRARRRRGPHRRPHLSRRRSRPPSDAVAGAVAARSAESAQTGRAAPGHSRLRRMASSPHLWTHLWRTTRV